MVRLLLDCNGRQSVLVVNGLQREDLHTGILHGQLLGDVLSQDCYGTDGICRSAGLLLMNRANFDELYSSITICVVAFILAYFDILHPILIIILAGITGYIIY